MSSCFFVFDTETTGATPDDKIVEVAYIEVDEYLNELRRGHSLIDPQRRISAAAMGVHNITEEMVVDAPSIEEYFSVVDCDGREPLSGEYILIAHRVDFDIRYLDPTVPMTRVGKLCTLRLARRYLPKSENHKLSTLAYQYGLDRGDAHSAEGDVRTCLSLVRFVITLSEKSLVELYNELRDPIVLDSMPFGKWKDHKFTEVPINYAQWCLGPPWKPKPGLVDLDPDLEHTLRLRAQGKI